MLTGGKQCRGLTNHYLSDRHSSYTTCAHIKNKIKGKKDVNSVRFVGFLIKITLYGWKPLTLCPLDF